MAPMSSILYSQRGAWQELIIALNKKIIFVNPDDLQIYKEIILPDDLTKGGLIENTRVTRTVPNPTARQSPFVQHVRLSDNGLLLAVTCWGQKAVLLYECRPEHAKLISIRSLARASSAIAFAPDGKFLLLTDKTGDCYHYDCKELQKPGELLLGHLSVVYDVILSPDQKCIISCDRDAKLRVTYFPACYDIKHYCWGHKEFISAIKLLPTDNQVLISISGDETIKFWNYEDGRKLFDFKLPGAAIKCAVRKVSENVNRLAVVFFDQQDEGVFVYEIITNDQSRKSRFEVYEVARYCFDSITVTDVCYAGEKLYVTGVKDERFVIRLIECTSSEMNQNVLRMITEQFQNETVEADDVSGWFKKDFDNVTDYYERKKRRIDERST